MNVRRIDRGIHSYHKISSVHDSGHCWIMTVHPFWSHHYDFSYDFRVVGRIVQHSFVVVQNLGSEPWNSVTIPLHHTSKILRIGVNRFDSSFILPTS